MTENYAVISVDAGLLIPCNASNFSRMSVVSPPLLCMEPKGAIKA